MEVGAWAATDPDHDSVVSFVPPNSQTEASLGQVTGDMVQV